MIASNVLKTCCYSRRLVYPELLFVDITWTLMYHMWHTVRELQVEYFERADIFTGAKTSRRPLMN